MKRFVAFLVMLLCLSLALAPQQVPSTIQPSSAVTSAFEQLKQQLYDLQKQITGYQKTIKELQAQLQSLKDDSETDKKLSMELRVQLTQCQQDLTAARTLYKQLSTQLAELNISYTISIQSGKVKTGIIIGLAVVVLGETIYILAKQ